MYDNPHFPQEKKDNSYKETAIISVHELCQEGMKLKDSSMTKGTLNRR
jgi:hypothetical protein